MALVRRPTSSTRPSAACRITTNAASQASRRHVSAESWEPSASHGALKEEAEDKKVRARQQAAEEKVRAREQVATLRKIGKEEREARRDYATNLRTHFLDTGADIEVSATGNNADHLVLRYVLFNAVWVHKFQTGDLINEIRGKGFKSVKFDDKYNYSWTIPLQ